MVVFLQVSNFVHMFVCFDEMHACTFIDCCLSVAVALTFPLSSPSETCVKQLLVLGRVCGCASKENILPHKICQRTLGLKGCQKSSESDRSAEISVA